MIDNHISGTICYINLILSISYQSRDKQNFRMINSVRFIWSKTQLHTFGFSQVTHLSNLSAFGTKLLVAFRRSFLSLLRDKVISLLLITSFMWRFKASRLMLDVFGSELNEDGLKHTIRHTTETHISTLQTFNL